MQMIRRRFLGMLAVSPIAAKQAAEDKALRLVGMVKPAGLSYGEQPMGQGSRDPSFQDRRMALKIPGVREQLIDQLYKDCRHVSSIDPDLAVKRSFSLAAQITFQRQRNVARRLAELEEEETYPLYRIYNIIKRAIGFRDGMNSAR